MARATNAGRPVVSIVLHAVGLAVALAVAGFVLYVAWMFGMLMLAVLVNGQL